jgi:hypothetical protein
MRIGPVSGCRLTPRKFIEFRVGSASSFALRSVEGCRGVLPPMRPLVSVLIQRKMRKAPVQSRHGPPFPRGNCEGRNVLN